MVVFGRVKKFMLRHVLSGTWLRIRAFFPRAKTFLRRNRYGLTAIKQAPAVIWTRKIKLAKLLVLVLIVYTCSLASNFCPALTSAPKITAEWVLPWLAGYHIGEPFEATLRITSPVALFVDLDSLRQEGETLGNLEIRGRADPHVYYIKEGTEVRKVTEFKFTLQYLKPLGEGVFTERALPHTYFGYRYRRQYSSGIHWVTGKTYAEETELYLTKRVQPGDAPFPLAGEVPEGRRFGWLLKALGVVVVLAVPAFHLIRFVYAWRSRPKPVLPEPEVIPGDKIRELLDLWWQTGDYYYFLVAAVWARIWAKQLLGLKPGELLPYHNDRCRCFHCRFRRLTNFALYSGKVLLASEVWEGFTLFLRLEPCKGDSEQSLPLPKPQRIRRWICRQASLLKCLPRVLVEQIARYRTRGKGGKDEI